jgi:7-cyano-7-deazaguanine synthase
MPKPKSVALLSGGLDSCVALAIAMEESEVLACLNVNYGQKHQREVDSADDIARFYNLSIHYLKLGNFGAVMTELHGSALIDKSEALPTNRRMSAMTAAVPRSYVPGRNTIMLALAQSVAEALNADEIYCGFNAVDFSGYPDCRPIFVEAWNHLAHYATKRGYENRPIILRAPIVNLGKASVVQRGLDLKAPLQLTWSCYAGGERPCGECDSCIIRWNAFGECGISDPVGAYTITPHRSIL